MKKIFFFFAITCFVQITFGQKISYLENNPIWNVNHSRGPCFEYGETNYYLSGDTSINNLTYKKVISKGFMKGMGGTPNMGCTNNFYYETYDDKNAIAFLRQENKKLFCRYNENINVEFLLYNFDLNPKDTFKFYYDKYNNNYYVSTVIDSVDSIFIDSGYRKVLYLSDRFNCGMGSGSHKIIEGIGSDHGLFDFCNSEFDSYNLNCFSMNGHSVYPTIDSSSCKIILGIKKMNSDQIGKILIYPNPAHDFITIDNKHIIGQLDIYDIHGQKIVSCQNSNTINISTLKEGIYLVKLTNHKTNDVEYLRFIKN